MSFLKPKTVIEEGEKVILYVSINNIYAIDVVPTIKNKKGEIVENIFQTNFGALKVKSLVGVQYGSKIDLSKGWAYVLQPNPELWTQTLPHRTQIIYTPDMSMICFQLEVKPGDVIIEAGTGSGSLSHYFLRAVKPFGQLHTFDFHEARSIQAREEFKSHGLADFVSVYHRDVCQNGFTDDLNGRADAVFLDLPSPHLAIPHALKALKLSGGRFCSFSPCIEQSQRCCNTLQELGFTEIQSLEIIQIEDIVKTKSVPIIDLEFLKTKKSKVYSNDLQLADMTTDDNKRKLEVVKTPKEIKKILTSYAPQTLPGHTGYLTFATILPEFAR